jgi:hypothetical protein
VRLSDRRDGLIMGALYGGAVAANVSAFFLTPNYLSFACAILFSVLLAREWVRAASPATAENKGQPK